MAEHPIGEMTTTELARYINGLQEALALPLSQIDRNLVLADLDKAHAEQNQRASVGAMPPAPAG